MALNKSKGNMYSFVTHTWNAIKGKCYHDCTYCYMKRWNNLRDVRLDQRELKTNLGSGNFIFVGSSCDMFARDIPVEWIEKILAYCRNFNNRYLFQSKDPALMKLNLNGDLDAVVCTTIETNRWYPDIMQNSPHPEDRAVAMFGFELPRYVTIEPIIDFDLDELVRLIKLCDPEQVNIGSDSGGNGLPEPSADKIIELVDALKEFTIIDQKRNLRRLLRKSA